MDDLRNLSRLQCVNQKYTTVRVPILHIHHYANVDVSPENTFASIKSYKIHSLKGAHHYVCIDVL